MFKLLRHPSVVAALVASFFLAVGWFVTGHFVERSSADAAKREVRLGHLLRIYRVVDATVRENNLATTAQERQNSLSQVPEALGEIQLLGTEREVELARQAARELSRGGGADLMPLLVELRESLREEMGLKRVSAPILFVEIPSAERDAVEQ